MVSLMSLMCNVRLYCPRQSFARTWEYGDMRLGMMHSRWKQKEHTGKYKDLELLGLKLPSPPPQNIYKRYNALRRSLSVSVVR